MTEPTEMCRDEFTGSMQALTMWQGAVRTLGTEISSEIKQVIRRQATEPNRISCSRTVCAAEMAVPSKQTGKRSPYK